MFLLTEEDRICLNCEQPPKAPSFSFRQGCRPIVKLNLSIPELIERGDLEFAISESFVQSQTLGVRCQFIESLCVIKNTGLLTLFVSRDMYQRIGVIGVSLDKHKIYRHRLAEITGKQKGIKLHSDIFVLELSLLASAGKLDKRNLELVKSYFTSLNVKSSFLTCSRDDAGMKETKKVNPIKVTKQWDEIMYPEITDSIFKDTEGLLEDLLEWIGVIKNQCNLVRLKENQLDSFEDPSFFNTYSPLPLPMVSGSVSLYSNFLSGNQVLLSNEKKFEEYISAFDDNSVETDGRVIRIQRWINLGDLSRFQLISVGSHRVIIPE